MRHVLTPVAIGLAGAALAAGSSTAAAAALPVSGTQVAVDEAVGKFRMTGSLLGAWTTTSFTEIRKTPLFEARGTEKFSGCLDRNRDRRCAGDPSGTLKFRFLYWGRFAAGDRLVWGSCWHPVVGGTGAFAGATGVLTMVDTPTAKGTATAYIGTLTMRGATGAARRAHRAAGCGRR